MLVCAAEVKYFYDSCHNPPCLGGVGQSLVMTPGSCWTYQDVILVIVMLHDSTFLASDDKPFISLFVRAHESCMGLDAFGQIRVYTMTHLSFVCPCSSD